MKRHLLFLLMLLLPTLSQGQSLLEKLQKFAGSADTLGRMEGSSYIIDGEGSITLEDGSTQPGTVKFIASPDNSEMRHFWFTPADEMKPRKVKSGEVAYFTVKGRQFYPIRMKEEDLSIGNARVFMERMNNGDNDRFKMYQLRKVEKNTSGIGDKAYDLNRGWYVALPEFKNAHDLQDLTFIPFAKKMSDYLKDCPELAKKIAGKEKGYKVNMFGGAGNDEVYFRIMNEYNACGQ